MVGGGMGMGTLFFFDVWLVECMLERPRGGGIEGIF